MLRALRGNGAQGAGSRWERSALQRTVPFRPRPERRLMPLKLILADDQALVREALKAVLLGLGEVDEVVEAGDFPGAAAAIAAHPDASAALVDLVMPGMQVPEGIAVLAEARPAVPILVISGHEEPEICMAALAAGARGYVPKSATREVFAAAIRLVLAGGLYLPPQLLAGYRVPVAGEGAPARPDPRETVRLTERQREVLKLLIAGRSNKDIARALTLSPATVKAHVATILGVLGAANRTEAVTRAAKLGLA